MMMMMRGCGTLRLAETTNAAVHECRRGAAAAARSGAAPGRRMGHRRFPRRCYWPGRPSLLPANASGADAMASHD